MHIQLICLAFALIAGLMLSRVTKLLHLPAVTGYLVAGLLIGPFCLGAIPLQGLGFDTLETVENFSVITQIALGFIAFTIGNEFRLSQLKSIGKSAITIGILQAVLTTALVDLLLIALHFAFPTVLSLPAAIILGAIASATAPAATLMVVRQYKADGPLTRLLLLVVAIDDAVGLLLFSASYGVATAIGAGNVSVIGVVVEPLIEIVASLALGALMGWLLDLVEHLFHSRSRRMTLSVAFVLLTVGLSSLSFDVGGVHVSFSLLLVCMMTGTIFCNICDTSEELMDRVDGWTMPLNILFFVLSGAELDLGVLVHPATLAVGIVYILARSLGKYLGAHFSCGLAHEDKPIQKNLGITLLPQAGVALGMAATAATMEGGALIRNVVLFAVLIYELVGPVLTKRSLIAVGEIKPEGRTSARKLNETA